MFAELMKALRMQTKDYSARFNSLDSQLSAQSVELAALRAGMAAQNDLLHEILATVTLPAAVSASLTYEGEDGTRREGASINVKIAIKKVGLLTLTLLNSTGGPGHADGIPVWGASVDGVVELTPAADGMSCGIKTLPTASPDEVKTTVVTVTADGDMGDGVTNIVAVFTATVYDPAGNSVIAEITAGEFTDEVAVAAIP